MIHDKRKFGIITVASTGELVEHLKEHSWTLCTGFALQELLFLNDAFSEDGAQEYAIVRQGRQIESFTVSWMSRAELHNDIDWLLQGGGEDYGPAEVQTEPIDEHSC